MTVIQVAVVDENGNPRRGVTVAAYDLDNFPAIQTTAVTNKSGVATVTVSRPTFIDAFDRRGVSFRDRSYEGKIQIQLVSLANFMNVDYVVDSNGFGTHLTLFGTSGAFADAISDAASRVIWICTTHTETVTTMTSLSGLSADQRIVIWSGGPWRPTISRAAAIDLFSMNTTSGGNTAIRFKGIDFNAAASTGTHDFCISATGVALPDIELEDVGFSAGTSASWDHIVNLGSAGSATTGRLKLRRVIDQSGSVDNIVRLVSASASSGSFWMEDCEFLDLETVSDRADAGEEAATDWGLGGSNQQLGIYILNNRLNISRILWRRAHNVPMYVVGNHIRSTHPSGTYLLSIGTSGTSSPKDAVISSNTISVHSSGAHGLRVTAGSGTASNIAIMGNALAGPGAGTANAITLDTAAESTTDGYAILNSYRDWTNNVTGAGATGGYSGVDHGTLLGLTDDDHTQYILASGTRNLTGNWEASTTAEGYYIQVAKLIVDDADHWLDVATSVGASADYPGNTSIGGTTDTVSAGEQNATKVVLASDTRVTSLSAYVDLNTLTRAFRLAVYSDNAGTPDALLFYCDDLTATTTAAWHTSTQLRDTGGGAISSYDLSAGTYWLSIHVRGGGGFDFTLFYDAAAAGNAYVDNADDYDTGAENPWSGGSAAARAYSSYITGAPLTTAVTWNVASGDSVQYDRSNNRFSFVIGSTNTVQIDGNGDLRATGYIAAGSLTAPTNVGDGDGTFSRLSVAQTGAFTTTGYFGRFGGTLTDTANGAAVAYQFGLAVSPTANSLADFRTIVVQQVISPSTTVTLDNIQTYRVENRWRSDATATSVAAGYLDALIIDSSAPSAWGNPGTVRGLFIETITSLDTSKTGTITDVIGIDIDGLQTGGASFTITTMRGLRVRNPSSAPTALTNSVGIDIEKHTRGSTLNAEFRNAGKMIYTPTTQTLAAAGNTIGSTARFQDIDNSTGALLTMTSTPTITAGQADGQLLTLTNTDSADSIAIQDETALAGSALRLPGAATLTLGPRDSVTLRWKASASEWWSQGASNN